MTGLALGAPFLIHWSQILMGLTCLERNDLSQACALAEPSVVYFRNEQMIEDLCSALWCLGMAHCYLGQFQRAGDLLSEGLAAGNVSQDAWAVGLAHYGLERVGLAQGDSARGTSELREGLVIFRRMGARREIAASLEALAALTVVEQQPKQAARLLGAAEALREEIGAPVPLVERPEHERVVAGSRAALDEAVFSSAWESGRAMGWKQAVSNALETDGSAGASTS